VALGGWGGRGGGTTHIAEGGGESITIVGGRLICLQFQRGGGENQPTVSSAEKRKINLGKPKPAPTQGAIRTL